MVTMQQRAQLHRILDNCILLSNTGTDVKFNFDNSNLRVEFQTGDNPCWFTSLAFSEPMSFSNLISVAEITEKEMGVDI